MKPLIPTNIITGFLGVGKTTAITHLLKQKPEGEIWSVLVNEFGEIGIDGALLKNVNAHVREVAGGCICCVGGLPMKMALNMMIATTKPDRIIIEPTGLGHPEEIINTLTGEYYDEVLDLKATLTLVDPRKLRDERYTGNATFVDQITVADILIANKIDLCDETDKALFHTLVANSEPAKSGGFLVSHGQLDTTWLDAPRSQHRVKTPGHHQNQRANPLSPQREIYNSSVRLPEGKSFVRRENKSADAFSCGWLFAPDVKFDFNTLFGWLSGSVYWRAKAVMNTDQGVYMFNSENGVLSINSMDVDPADILDSRIELIDDNKIDGDEIESILLGMRL